MLSVLPKHPNQLTSLSHKPSSPPTLDQLLTSTWLTLSQPWTLTLMPDHNKFTYQLMRRETLHLRYHQLINSILSTVLLLNLSERSLVTIPSSPSEKRTDQRAKTSQTTTTLPSPWWSRESQSKLPPPQPRTHTTQMVTPVLLHPSIKASHTMIEHWLEIYLH